MEDFRTKIEANGRVVLPAACRRQLHLIPGETLIIRIDHDELRLFTLKHSLKKAQSLVKKHAKNESLAQKLIDSRREEAKDE